MSHKPLASLSLDLDNQWSYMKTHGDEGWQDFPSYLDLLAPRIVDLLRDLGLTITIFVVGQDAALPANHAALRQLAAAGHEIGNHSFRHEPWLHLYTAAELENELEAAETAILWATGRRPTGFRGPGFSLSVATLRALKRRGYHYDASTFPTYLGPLARAYYFRKARLSAEERSQRAQLFGGFKDGLRPLAPYRWSLPEGALLEIPVTTLPLLKTPFHASYLLYLAGVSETLALAYFRIALMACKLARIAPSLLLHPLDCLGGDDVTALRFFPAMAQTGGRKLKFLRRVLEIYRASFDVVPLGVHAERLNRQDRLPMRAPDFPPGAEPEGVAAGSSVETLTGRP